MATEALPIELLQGKIVQLRNSSVWTRFLQLTDLLISQVENGSEEGFKLVLTEVVKIYAEGEQNKNIKWYDIFKSCVNSPNPAFLKMVEEEETLPSILAKGFDVGKNHCDINTLIYANTASGYTTFSRVSGGGLYTVEKEYLDKCPMCENVNLCKLIHIRSKQIYDYLKDGLCLKTSDLIHNIDFTSPEMKQLITSDDMDADAIVKLFQADPYTLTKVLDIGDQMEMYIQLLDSDEEKAIGLFNRLIFRHHTELIKLLIDVFPAEKIPDITAKCITHRKTDLTKLCYKRLKSEPKSHKLTELITNVGKHITEQLQLVDYVECFGDLIESDVFDAMLKRESAKNNFDLDFFTLLTKYHQDALDREKPTHEETELIEQLLEQHEETQPDQNAHAIPLNRIADMSEVEDIEPKYDLAKELMFDMDPKLFETAERFCRNRLIPV